jgi:hypothetical protein
VECVSSYQGRKGYALPDATHSVDGAPCTDASRTKRGAIVICHAQMLERAIGSATRWTDARPRPIPIARPSRPNAGCGRLRRGRSVARSVSVWPSLAYVWCCSCLGIWGLRPAQIGFCLFVCSWMSPLCCSSNAVAHLGQTHRGRAERIIRSAQARSSSIASPNVPAQHVGGLPRRCYL